MIAAALAASALLLATAVEPAEAAFPGTKNGKIAYNLERKGMQVRVVKPNGTHPTTLTNNDGEEWTNNGSPNWSPDGIKIAFNSDRDDDPDAPGRRADLYVMNADGSKLRRLTETPTVTEATPTWSPDGQQLAFSRGRDIYKMNLDGTEDTRLTTNPGSDFSPAWSPDGTKIAFNSCRDDACGLFTMAPVPEGDDNQPQRLAGGNGGFAADWSPDGEKIAFTDDAAPPESHDPQYQVFVMNADGTNTIRLTTGGGRYPAWSPNGKKIAFVRYNSYVYVMNLAPESDTNIPKLVTKGSCCPDWQPIVQ